MGTAAHVTVQFEEHADFADGDEGNKSEHDAAEIEYLMPGSGTRYEGYEVVIVRPEWLQVYEESHPPARGRGQLVGTTPRP